MKAVVTGANGFLGNHIVRHLRACNWEVVGVDRSLPRIQLHQETPCLYRWALPDPRWAALLREFAPDFCIHCAGSASVPLSYADPTRDYVGGPQLVFELLESLRRESPRTRFIFLSSAAVYGHPRRLPVSELEPPAPISPYGAHKWQAEQLCQEFSKFFGLGTASLRIFSAYGRGLRRQVIWDICDKLLHPPAVVLQGSGSETRDFIHGRDVAQAVECVASRAEFAGECYNVASGRETEISALGRQLSGYLAVQREMVFSGVVPEGTPLQWRADIDRLERLGFRQQVALAEGLRDFAAWVREEQSWHSVSESA
jgi:UDP-glucose 4-epimerase